MIISEKIMIEQDEDDPGHWVISMPSIPGLVSQGDSIPEALRNMAEAYELWHGIEKPEFRVSVTAESATSSVIHFID